MKPLNTHYMNLTDLKPHPKNVRVGNIKLIKESLQYHGQYRPIVIQDKTNYILAGNHTYKAAQELGWTQLATVIIECDNDQALRILLMDNRANDKATYNNQELIELLDELTATELELAGTGFDNQTLDELLDSPEIDLTDTQQQNITEKYEVIIDCDNETQQGELLLQLSEQGYRVRSLIV